MKNLLKITVLAGFLVIPFFAAPPAAQAFSFEDLVDPLCLFRDCDDPDVINNVNSNNNNSNVNSPGGVVNNSGNTNTSNNSDDDDDFDDDDDDYHYGNLVVTCYAYKTRVEVGEKVTWGASAHGGTGSYSYSWDGSEGLSGSGSTVSIRYDDEGSKRAEVRVRSGGQTVNRACGDTVQVYDDGYYDDDYDDDYYDNDNRSLSVTCYPDRSYGEVDDSIRWTADARGGNGRYTYDWDGTANIRGSGRTLNVRYHDTGIMRAEVTVRSNGRTITRTCSPSVTIGSYTQTRNSPVYSGTLNASCAPDRTSATVGAPVAWSVYATGGTGAYTYQWSGSENLSNNRDTFAMGYGSTGSKVAEVTVYSGGESITRSCGTIQITASTGGRGGTVTAPRPSDDSNDDDNDGRSGLSASSILSLENVPWGWVAIFVILVLLGTIVYLVFNKSKI